MPTGPNNNRYVVIQDPGATGWHTGTLAGAEYVGMEDILDGLADDVLLRGDGTPDSNSRTPYVGRVYLDTGATAGVEGEVYRADGTNWLKVGRITQISEVGQISFPTRVTQYSSGLSSAIIARYPTAANEVVSVYRLGIRTRSGLTDPSLTVALRDESTGTTLATTSTLTTSTGAPLGTSNPGGDITLRLTNGTNDTQNVSITGRAVIEAE